MSPAARGRGRRAASCGVGCRRASSGVVGRLVLEQQRRVLEAQVGPERVDAAVGGGAVGAQRALRRVRVEVVPAVGHLLAARLAAPQRRAVRRRHEHAVVRVLRRVRALCNATYRRRHASRPTPPDRQYFAMRYVITTKSFYVV